MARKREKPGKIGFTSSDGGGAGTFKRFCVTSLILLIISMVFVAVAVQTNKGSDEIKKYLSKLAGEPVHFEKASIGWPYVLVLDGVESEDFDLDGEEGFRVEEARIGLRFNGDRVVKLYGCTLFLVQDADKQWVPGVFDGLGDLPLRNVADITRLTLGFRDRVRLSIEEGAIKWKSIAGVGASASKIEFEMSRIKMPRQVMYGYYLVVHNALGVDGVRSRDIKREWLASEKDDYIEIARSEDVDLKDRVGFWDDDGSVKRVED
jgi:hypothetical protein